MIRSFVFNAASVFTLAAAATSVASAQATIPQSRLNVVGAVNIQNSPGNAANLLLDFLAGPASDIGGTPTGTLTAVPTENGIFSIAPTITPGVQGTISDLTVSQMGIVGQPVASFMTIGGYTFTLTGTQNSPGALTFGPIALNAAGTRGSTATLDVTGTVTGPNSKGVQSFDGVFTAQFAGLTPQQVFNTINSGGQLSAVSVSAEFNVPAFNTPPVTTTPEPATYALLASGLGMLGVVARRRRVNA